jgi:hypothetical protein
MTDMAAAVQMIKLGIGDLMVPVDKLPHDLRRRWDMAQARAQNGEDMRGAIRALLNEIQVALGPEIMFRAAHASATPHSAMEIGNDVEKDAGPGALPSGSFRLRAPVGHTRTEVWTATGRRVKPNERGEITVSAEEAHPLIINGWSLV